mmetsp:Transcript_61451/g.146544  ORF Transcript_61451/g.146544 Transcript_61451/m.146544 type:complete len:466 (-) Transcript_61451:105-1502(-)|eukprot:CAMPEP_0178383880 /NCGR_PEP_ID=MMETSP0689_2-20121128/7228_1 /TAXON_ID=160604 /ORGANISM="Amphidinium massartii, Strain CS-259" /LENGTH=465 /DNA_ID=CAMNT_0020004111 /DNA_START=54 /DNA_END=1451 /DNA_ORIENTATION=+
MATSSQVHYAQAPARMFAATLAAPQIQRPLQLKSDGGENGIQMPSTPGRASAIGGPYPALAPAAAAATRVSARTSQSPCHQEAAARAISPRSSPPGVRRPVREELPSTTSPDTVSRGEVSAAAAARVRLHPRGANSHGGLPSASSQQRFATDGAASTSNLHQSSSASSGVDPACHSNAVAAALESNSVPTTTAITAATAIAGVSSSSTTTSLLAGSSLGHLITRMQTSLAEREQALQEHLKEKREMEDLIGRSKDELQQLISVVSQLHELQLSASEVLPELVNPERTRQRREPPFFWLPSVEYADEFDVSGDAGEVVTKVRDFEDQGWVIPVGGSLRMQRGGLYRWTLRIERKCPSRPQLQLGIHGMNHSQPWRLITTSRCSWSRDDEPWQDRPAGDRLIDEGDCVHMEVDLRGIHSKFGSLALAINDEPFEQFFDDIPLNTPYPLMPVVSMGGDQSRVRLVAGP